MPTRAIAAGLCVLAVAALGAACSGSEGPAGPAGADGTNSATGATGSAGAPGATGPAGPQGDAGTTGATGPTGPTGPAADASTTAPADAGPPTSGLVLWLRSDTGVTLANDGTVASWKDLTGLGNRDAAPAFNLPGPLYVQNAYKGLPALRCDGTSRSLFVNGGHGYPIGTASAVYLVTSASTDTDAAVPTFDIESSQGRQYSVMQLTNGSVVWANLTNASALAGNSSFPASDGGGDLVPFTAGPPGAGLHVFAETQLDGVSGHLYLDGNKVASFVPEGPSVYLMALMGGPGDAFNGGNNDPLGLILSAGSFNPTGDLVEVLQYDGESTDSQTAAIQTYLAERYGLP